MKREVTNPPFVIFRRGDKVRDNKSGDVFHVEWVIIRGFYLFLHSGEPGKNYDADFCTVLERAPEGYKPMARHSSEDPFGAQSIADNFFN